MHKMWRWRICAIGWVAGAYICILSLISVINLASTPRVHSDQQLIYNRETHDTLSSGLWRGSIRRRSRNKGIMVSWCHTLHWVDPPGPTTALVSFPGSGNTWLRYLIQQATGSYTGSVYKDYALLKNGFPAESVANGSVVVVKTHEYGGHIRSLFSRGIIIIRDPYESIISEFNRQSGGHIGHAPHDKYKKDNGELWKMFAKGKAVNWMNTTLDWLQLKGPLHIVFYKDLVNNLTAEMLKILEFLEVKVTEEDFKCMIKHQNGIYRRRKKDLPFNPFNPMLRKWVEVCKNQLGRSLKKYMTEHSLLESLARYHASFFNS